MQLNPPEDKSLEDLSKLVATRDVTFGCPQEVVGALVAFEAGEPVHYPRK